MRRGHTRLLAGALTLAAGLSATASASAAGFDDTFGLNGTAFSSLSPVSDRYQNATKGPAGGTYNVGYTTVGGTDRALVLTRVDANGELVESFGDDGVALVNVVTGPFAPGPNNPPTTPNGTAEIARGVVVQSDGKIVISGQAETPPSAGKPDSRDIDIYVARFNTNGTPDNTFGVDGVKRIDLSNGVGAGNTVNGDQSYGLSIRPNGKLLLVASRGLDSATPTKTDREIAVVQLLTNGDPDPGFGTNGVAIILNPGISENPRQGVLHADGKFVATGYGSATGGQTRPFLYRFNENGTPDATFGTGGLATGAVGGPAPGYAEVYEVVSQGDNYILGGYGARSTSANGEVDQVVYRFTGAGVWDQAFGTDGLVTYGVAGSQERIRDLSLLPDGRIVAVGSTATLNPTVLDGLITVFNPAGTLAADYKVDLGGTNDAFFGSTVVNNGTKVVAAGYRGGATTDGDEAALVRVDLTPAAAGPAGSAGPAGQDGQDGQDGPAGPQINGSPGTPGAQGPQGSAGPRGANGTAAGRVSVSCKLTGKRKNKISCTTRQARAAKGTVKLRLKKAGKVVASGKGTARAGKATVTLSGKARAGRYTLLATLPSKQVVELKVTIR